MKPTDDMNRLPEIELAEQWLAGFPSPLPTNECIARIRQAVRLEQSAIHRVDRDEHRYRYAVLAVAASIGLVFFAGWWAMQGIGPTGLDTPMARSSSPTRPMQNSTSFGVESETGGDSYASVVLSTSIDQSLTTLESWSEASDWDISGSTLSAALDEIYSDSPTTSSANPGASS